MLSIAGSQRDCNLNLHSFLNVTKVLNFSRPLSDSLVLRQPFQLDANPAHKRFSIGKGQDNIVRDQASSNATLFPSSDNVIKNVVLCCISRGNVLLKSDLGIRGPWYFPNSICDSLATSILNKINSYDCFHYMPRILFRFESQSESKKTKYAIINKNQLI